MGTHAALQIRHLQQRVEALEAENRMLRESSESKSVILKQILATIDETNVAPDFTGEKASRILRLFTMSVASRGDLNRRTPMRYSTGRRTRARVPSTSATIGVLSCASPFVLPMTSRTATHSVLFTSPPSKPPRPITSVSVS